MVEPNLEKLMTPRDVAEMLGLSVAWVRDHTTRHEPKLPGIQLGSRWRYRPSDIEEFLKKHGIRQDNAAA